MSSAATTATARQITAIVKAATGGARWETTSQGPEVFRVVLRDDLGQPDHELAAAALAAIEATDGLSATWSYARGYVTRLVVMTVVDERVRADRIARHAAAREEALEAARAEVAAADAARAEVVAFAAKLEADTGISVDGHRITETAEAAWEEEAHAAGFASGDDYAAFLTDTEPEPTPVPAPAPEERPARANVLWIEQENAAREAQRRATAAEPHAFIPARRGQPECYFCGEPAEDRIHANPDSDPLKAARAALAALSPAERSQFVVELFDELHAVAASAREG